MCICSLAYAQLPVGKTVTMKMVDRFMTNSVWQKIAPDGTDVGKYMDIKFGTNGATITEYWPGKAAEESYFVPYKRDAGGSYVFEWSFRNYYYGKELYTDRVRQLLINKNLTRANLRNHSSLNTGKNFYDISVYSSNLNESLSDSLY